MTFIARILRYLLWFVVVSWSVAILRRIVGKMVSGGVQSNPHMDVPNNAVNQKLVRDPVCGIHVAQALALQVKQDGETLHFCSPECRDKYLGEIQKLFASA